MVNLTVNGQPVETTTPGKKHKPGKVVSTEVVQVPGPERHSLSFSLSTDEPLSQRSAAPAGREPCATPT
ncbi:MAG: hypothetical protein WKG07_03945 [Hymenobacter sp.]